MYIFKLFKVVCFGAEWTLFCKQLLPS